MNNPYLIDNSTTQAGSIFSLTTVPLGFSITTVMDQEIKKAATILGRKGGMTKTKAKARAARLNGKKGGRPRKVQLKAS